MILKIVLEVTYSNDYLIEKEAVYTKGNQRRSCTFLLCMVSKINRVPHYCFYYYKILPMPLLGDDQAAGQVKVAPTLMGYWTSAHKCNLTFPIE